MPKYFHFPNGQVIKLTSGDLPLNNVPFRVDSKAQTTADVKAKSQDDELVDDDDIEADEPVKKARREQNDRITGKSKANAKKAGIDFDATGLSHNDSVDPIALARAEQLRRITANH